MQQINLYQQGIKIEAAPLSAASMVIVGGAFIFGYLLLAIYSAAQVSSLETQVAVLSEQTKQAHKDLEMLEKTLPAPVKSRLLEAQIGRVGYRVKTRLAILQQIGPELDQAARGFVAHLEGLARQHVDGTWLTHMEISSSGKSLALQGQALQPELIPVYLQRLSDEAIFNGTGFEMLSISRAEDPEGSVQFQVRTPIVEGGS